MHLRVRVSQGNSESYLDEPLPTKLSGGSTMAENDREKADEKFIKDLVQGASATRAITKLNTEPKEIKVYRYGSQVQILEDALYDIDSHFTEENRQKNPSQKTLDALNKIKKDTEERLKKHDENMIEGILMPLKYRDINLVKAAATEAVIDLQEHNFDHAVVMTRLIAEERYMTVFCALREKDNPKQRYFKNLEEIALSDDITILNIYQEWENHFVITEDELKNS